MLSAINFDFLTEDSNVKNDETYKIIVELLSDLVKGGAVTLGTGYCLSMADMIRTALKHRGIDSKLVDCQATFSYDGKLVKGNMFIGYPNVVNPGEIDTHVVVVTSTNPSYLIDASVSNKLPTGTYAVIEPIKFNSDNQLTLVNSTYEKYDLKITYQQKKLQSASYQHQKSIIERIEMDKKITDDIQLLKTLNYIGIGLSTFAFINVVAKIFGWYSYLGL